MPLPFGAVLGGLGRAVAGGTKAAAKGAVRGVRGVRAGVARGRRAKGRRRDRIQEKMFGGGGGDQQKGGAIVKAQSRAITKFNVPPTSQEVGATPTGGGILGILDAINGTLSQILEIEKQQRDSLQQSILNAAKDKEQAQRTAEQQKQETKKPRKRDRVMGAVKNLAAGPLSWLMDFVKLGILNWFGDPKNKEAVQNIVKFFQAMVKAIQWTWKWIIAPLGKFIWMITEPTLKKLGNFITFLGKIFTGAGKIFTDPAGFFKSLIDIPLQLVRVVPNLVVGFVKWIGGALWGAAKGIVGGIISAIRNLFGGIFGGGGDKSGGANPSGTTTTSEQYTEVAGEKYDPDNPTPDQVQAKELESQMADSRSGQPQKLKGETLSSKSNADGRTQSAAQPTSKFLGDKKTSTAAKGEDKPEGFMRGLAGVGDFMTGGLFDLDKRGDSGLQTFQKGVLDFATGGLTDFDGKGGKTWGTARLLGGFADKITGDRWDFDRHGKSGTILDEVQRQRKDLDTVPSGASQETYAFGQDSNSAVQEVASTAMVGGTLPRNGRWSTYKTVL